MKIKRKQMVMLVMLAIFAALLVVTIITGGKETDGEYTSIAYATIFSLLPPVIAIGLALFTKEVYTSLLAGILAGALLYSNGNLETMVNTMFFHEEGGMVYKLADAWNVGIIVFLVMLGILVSLLNKAGGSAAFGKWASKRIKTRIGAQISVMILGVMIFVDDYFNCLTVGSVMRPVTDRHKVSRAKLSYIIDATAAPVCIIAPISSWAAAVTSSVPSDSGINGFAVFIQTIPYNLYAILTLVMLVAITLLRVDFGPMKRHEMNAIAGDLFTTPGRPYEGNEEEVIKENSHVLDLFPSGQMMAISISSCLAGAVCGDHCSPISDTTIMASAGGHCEHVNHVATQIPYVALVAAVCMVGYFIIGVLQAVGMAQLSLISLPICIVILVGALCVIRAKTGGKEEI